jgi:hypothetical protein
LRIISFALKLCESRSVTQGTSLKGIQLFKQRVITRTGRLKLMSISNSSIADRNRCQKRTFPFHLVVSRNVRAKMLVNPEYAPSLCIISRASIASDQMCQNAIIVLSGS